jgi:DNA (cytosine-5)-methyltransferase 1
MKKNLLSLFTGCGGMDIGFEGGFKIPKATINYDIHQDWIEKEDDTYYHLKETFFETTFANDISAHAKIAWNDYFSKKRGYNLNGTFKVGSIVDIVKEYRSGNTKIFPQNIDIVTGGFPCQDFSVAGKRNGFNSHKDHHGNIIDSDMPTEETRGKLYMWMKEVIEITLPKIFIAENVKGLANLGEVKKSFSPILQTSMETAIWSYHPRFYTQVFSVCRNQENAYFLLVLKNQLYQKKP